MGVTGPAIRGMMKDMLVKYDHLDDSLLRLYALKRLGRVAPVTETAAREALCLVWRKEFVIDRAIDIVWPEKQRQLLRRYLLSQVGDNQITDDLMQTLYVIGMERFQEWDPDRSSFQTWIEYQGRSLVRDLFREQSRHVPLYNEDDEPIEIGETMNLLVANDPATAVVQRVIMTMESGESKPERDTAKILRVALALGPKFSGLTAKEMVKETGWTRQAIQWKIKTAKLRAVTMLFVQEEYANTDLPYPVEVT